MQLRYMGFDQAYNIREFKFDRVVEGESTKHFVVSADLVLFLKHHIGIQEGPSLCLQKLSTDVERLQQLHHELTNDDLLAYVSARASGKRRKSGPRRWRGPRKVATIIR